MKNAGHQILLGTFTALIIVYGIWYVPVFIGLDGIIDLSTTLARWSGGKANTTPTMGIRIKLECWADLLKI